MIPRQNPKRADSATSWSSQGGDPPASGLRNSRRLIAITFDDLPSVESRFANGVMMVDLARDVCSKLQRQRIPAIGFVNESRLFTMGEIADRIESLCVWANHGVALGNHTFSHLSLNEVSLEVWKDDVVRGDTITRLLQSSEPAQIRYFRPPFLDMGVDLGIRRDALSFLASRGYRLAPVTIDTWDWLFGEVYDVAARNHDIVLLKSLGDSYRQYLKAVCSYYESLSSALVGYPIKQVLLLHANQFTAIHLESTLDVLRDRGYAFVSLTEALEDDVYRLSDDYCGQVGISWLDRWAITHGVPEKAAPQLPAWLLDRYNAMGIGIPIIKRWFRPPRGPLGGNL